MTTNYTNTFIAVAPDCPIAAPEVPPMNAAKPTVAALQYQLLAEHPYEMTSDEILFSVHVIRAAISDAALESERALFFEKDQACFRSSPLGKRYGWGTHHDEHGRMALHGLGTAEYERLVSSPDLVQKLAMRSRRA